MQWSKTISNGFAVVGDLGSKTVTLHQENWLDASRVDHFVVDIDALRAVVAAYDEKHAKRRE